MSDNQSKSSPKRGEYAREKGEVILREHEFDGIQEYDQKLPNWWLFTLYGAIVFFVGYWVVYYNANAGQTDQARITNRMNQIASNKEQSLQATLATLDDATLVHQWASDPTILEKGSTIYSQVCIGCHGAEMDAKDGLGLSLVDHEWKYGNRPLDIFKLINEGTPAASSGMEPTGARMIPWGSMYSPEQIAQLTAFIISKVPEDFTEF